MHRLTVTNHPTPGRRERRLRRLVAATGVLAMVAGGLVAAASPAAAATTATGTTTTTAQVNTTTAIPGMSVSGTTGTSLVTLSTDLGEVSLPTHADLTLAYGYSSWTGPQISFTGTETDINSALADADLLPGATAGTARIDLSVAPQQQGLAYSGETGHYYRYVQSPGVDWTAARSAAESSSYAGQPGYLVQIPDASVNAFVTSKIQGAVNVWIGGSATNAATPSNSPDPVQRTWSWAGGPLDGQMFTQCSELTGGGCTHIGDSGAYHSWAPGEPNNSGGTEDKAVTNWNTADGRWNDLDGANTSNIAGYVVEYGGLTNQDDNGSGFTGLGEASSTITVTGPPSAPTGTSATLAGGGAQVSWTAPSTLNGSTITGYTVTASPGGATCTAAADETSCTVTGLAPNTGHTFTVVAHSDLGDSAAGGASNTVTTPAVPAAPTAVSGTTPRPEQILVSWTAPASNGTPITGYVVTASPGGRTCAADAATTACTLTGLTAGTSYTLSVVATSGNGDSPAGTSAEQVTAWSRGRAIPIEHVVVGDHEAHVTWDSATPVGTTVARYTAVSYPGRRSCTTTGVTCTIRGLVRGRVYTIRVTAFTADGVAVVGSSRGIARPRVDVAVAPRVVYAGRKIWMTANGFAPNATVQVRLNRTGRLLGYARANNNGVIGPVGFTIPRTAKGWYGVHAIGAKVTGGTRYRSQSIWVKRRR